MLIPNQYKKGRPVPMHFQNTIRQELEKLIEKGHLGKADQTPKNCFVSPAVRTIKKVKSVEILSVAPDFGKKATMPNMEDLISKILAKITKSDGEI